MMVEEEEQLESRQSLLPPSTPHPYMVNTTSRLLPPDLPEGVERPEMSSFEEEDLSIESTTITSSPEPSLRSAASLDKRRPRCSKGEFLTTFLFYVLMKRVKNCVEISTKATFILLSPSS